MWRQEIRIMTAASIGKHAGTGPVNDQPALAAPALVMTALDLETIGLRVPRSTESKDNARRKE
jgi:hypothetical protein